MTVKSYIVAGEGNRCFTCGKKCYEDALVITEHNEIDKEDIYFCGDCIYHNTAIGRPCSNWISKLELDREEKRKKRAESKAKREHERWLKQFCCRTYGEMMHKTLGDEILLGYEGEVTRINARYHEGKEYDDMDFKYNFKYCPYCRKEFIHKKK